MSGNKSEEIIVPALNINETIKPFLEEITGLSRQANTINHFNPLASRKLIELSRSKTDMRKRYYNQLDDCYKTLEAPVSGPGFTIGFAQTWSTAKGVSAIFKLQDAWKDFESTLDRKTSLIVAMLAMYISVLSLTVSFAPLVLKVVDLVLKVVDP
jgi:hypothetical protein